MVRSFTLLGSSLLLLATAAIAPLSAEEPKLPPPAVSQASAKDAPPAGPRLELRAANGSTFHFVVRREEESSRDEKKQHRSSEAEYAVTFAEVKDGRNATLEVKYVRLKSKSTGGEHAWDFDSTQPAAADGAARSLGELIASPITVSVTGGRVGEVKGFLAAPGREVSRDARMSFFAARMVAGPEALRRDLELIVNGPLLGKPLAKGKAYSVLDTEPAVESGDDAKDSSARVPRRAPLLGLDQSFQFEFAGEEPGGGAPAAKFTISAAAAASGAAGGVLPGGFKQDVDVKGVTSVSMADGMTLAAEVSTRVEFRGKGANQTERVVARTTKATISRKPAAAAAAASPPK